MDGFNALSFREWLRNNTDLQESSIALYARTINAYFEEHKVFDVEKVNKFVSRSVRSKNCYYMKYAFKFYMDFAGKRFVEMTDDNGHKEKIDSYKQIVKVKTPPRKKLGTYVNDEELQNIIKAIDDDKWRDVAAIQYATAARARGIITLHELNIDFTFDKDSIKLRLVEKGRKEKEVYLNKEFESILKKYVGKGFLFLPEYANKAEDEDYSRIVSNAYTYYYTAVSNAGKAVGLPHFGTHDFRRNVAESWKRKGVSSRTLQQALGHSSIVITEKYFGTDMADARKAMLKHQGGKE